MILTVRNITASYNNEQILHDISFSMQKGEILCLLGTSGSGKTTLLRTIAGLQNPDSGQLLFQQQEITGLAPHKRQFGMMFQDYALFPHKNVAQNVAFGLQMQGIPQAQQQQRIDEILQMVGLADYKKRKITELSGGQQQRVALARSLAPRPQMLLLDEPLGSLDRSMRDYLATELRSILKQLNMTTIFVTHDQSEAFSLADRVAILLNGKIVQLATPQEIYQHPATCEVASFLGFKNFLSLAQARELFAQMPQFSDDSHQEKTLLLRPEGASTAKDKSHLLIIRGELTTKSYLGAHYRITVKVNQIFLSFDLPLCCPLPATTGERIVLYIEPDALVWLPDFSS